MKHVIKRGNLYLSVTDGVVYWSAYQKNAMRLPSISTEVMAARIVRLRPKGSMMLSSNLDAFPDDDIDAMPI